MAKKLSKSQMLGHSGPPGDTTEPTLPPRRWVEAKALPTNDARVVVKFLKSLFSRFGAPRAIISDRGTHFCSIDKFDRVYGKAGHLTVELDTKRIRLLSIQLRFKDCRRSSKASNSMKLSETSDQAYEKIR
ncbi:reverse transcriptase domain-containing protein [Tanacetum coccineum]